LNKNNLRHIALILDGNKRWAKKNGNTNINGYKKGFENIKFIVDHGLKLNLKDLTLFTLSSENFNRPSINIIYQIINENFSKLLDDLAIKRNIKINIFGSRSNLPKKIINIFEKIENKTANNNSLNLNLAFNYGFKEEIKGVLENFKKNVNINLDNHDEIRKLFFLGNNSDPDILIRTGGYQRLSNFIMYNLTYTELFFTKTLWPDFSTDEFDKIIMQYSQINRKYGL